MPGATKSKRAAFGSWAIRVFIFALVLACYWPSLRGGLVWDDDAHVTRAALRSWAGLGRIWTDLHATQQYYPVLHSAFWVEHRLWGDATLGYHLLNVVLHATSCCLLALVLTRLSEPGIFTSASPPSVVARSAKRSPGSGANPAPSPEGKRAPFRGVPADAAWIVAILFAVHPVYVESVAWISEQKNTLSLVFYLLAALAYLDFDATRRWRSYALAALCFALALGTKSVTATLPAALLLVLWWKRGTLRWRTDVVPLLPWFGVAMTAGLFTAWVERTLIGAAGAAFELTFPQRLLLAGRVVWFYLGKLLWPSDLIFVYPRWDVPGEATRWIGWLAAGLAVTAALWQLRTRTRGPLTAWLFFVGSLFPALGFFNVYPFRFSYVADHFQYLASLGLIVLAAVSFAWGLARVARPARMALMGAGVILVGSLAIAANHQSRAYHDGETLYRTTLQRNPGCWMAHNNLAAEIAGTPARVPEALEHYADALRLKPDYAEAHNNLGNSLFLIPGRQAEAIGHFEEALRIAPEFLEARLNLANALAKTPGRMDDALTQYAETLRRKPDYPEAHFCLGNTLVAMTGHAAEALAEYAETIRLRPEFADAHYNYGVMLERVPGREEEALAEYQEALRLRPNYAEAHNNLAILLAQRGRYAEAREHWEAAVRLKPNYEDALRNLELLELRTRK